MTPIDLFSERWFQFGLMAVVGYPIAVVLLGEIAERLQHHSSNLARTILLLRSAFLPLLVVLLILQVILERDSSATSSRVAISVAVFVGISMVLSIVNAVVFDRANDDTWRGRTPALFVDISRFALILIGGSVVVATVWGFNLGGLLAAAGLGGLIVGLALQDTLASLMGGIALLFDKPFTVGDWIEVDGLEGVVTDINWRTVRVETREEDLVVIPNIVFGNSRLVNNSRPEKRHLDRIDVTFSEIHPPHSVASMLLDAAAATEGVLAEPKPKVHTVSQGDSAFNYRVVLSMPSHDEMLEIRSAYMNNMWYYARRAGIEFPTPNRFHFSQSMAEMQSESSERDLSRRTVALAGIDVAGESLAELAPHSTTVLFGVGEMITAAGDGLDEVFLVVEGRSVGFVADSRGREEEVLRFSEGEFLGLAGLVNGRREEMSVRAVTDVETIRIPGAVLRRFTDRTPLLMTDLQGILSSRLAAVERVRANLEASVATPNGQGPR